MHPKVSIVIVNLNRAALTLDCVKSIVAHTERDLYEVIVVDNGSAAAETEKLVQASHQFKLIPLDRNMFFGEASNIGAEHGSGDYVLFLNNDVKVTAGWLDALLAVFNTEYRAGAAGPKIVYPNGELQEAGCVVRPDGWGVQIGKSGMELPLSFIDATRIVDYCSGSCLLMRRRVFLDLGGFDPIFDPAYFEDVDLAIRLRSIGLFTYYCGGATVCHEESVTSNRIWSAERRREYIRINHDRLLTRWGAYLRGRLDEDREPTALAPIAWSPEPALADANSIVLYCSTPPDGGMLGRSLLQTAVAFQDVLEIVIAADEIFSRCRIYSLCREFGLSLRSFQVRKISEVDQSTSKLFVTFDKALPSQFAGRQFAFPGGGQALVRFLEDFA